MKALRAVGSAALAVLLNCLLGASPSLAADPLDWPHWRGPEQNGISREKGLVVEWDPTDGTNVLWQNRELGGISTPIVMNGKIYVIARHAADTPHDCEKVVCADINTGKKIWEHRFNVFLSDVPAERIGWSSCEGDPSTGHVFVQGVCGLFMCLDGESGEVVWQRSLSEEFGLLTTYGGRTNVPVVFEDLVIISGVITGWGDQARPAHRLLAFNKKTGETVWFAGTRPLPEDTTYSTPFVTVLNGQAAIVFGSGDGGVYAFQPRTGKPIWNFQLSRRGLNVSPIVDNQIVYMAHAEENTDNTSMGAIIAIDGKKTGNVTQSAELWRVEGMDGKSSPVLLDGRLYAFDDGGKLLITDVVTGKPVGKPIKMTGTIVRGSPVCAEGRIYACTTSGWHVFEPTKDGAKVVHRVRMPEEDEISASPVISHGKILLTTGAQMYCIGKPNAKTEADPRPKLAEETPLGANDAPAIVQVVPAEVLMKPGKHQQFTVKLYNARGQFLRNGTASFSLSGSGEVSKDGNFVAPSGNAHSASILTAKVDDLQAQARIRVVPDLPWKFDFADSEIPVTWVGARYRHVPRDLSGEKVAVKITTIPKGTRSQSWMGPTDFHDYTIQADVMGARTNDKMPDTGVIAQRYTLDLMGASQKLQIRSWSPQLKRFSKTIDYAWEPNTWYTLKLQAVTDGNKVVLKGKAWKRDTPEPKEWTIEAVDQEPNYSGSPGLFGNANDAEITIDNVIVTKNGAK